MRFEKIFNISGFHILLIFSKTGPYSVITFGPCVVDTNYHTLLDFFQKRTFSPNRHTPSFLICIKLGGFLRNRKVVKLKYWKVKKIEANGNLDQSFA